VKSVDPTAFSRLKNSAGKIARFDEVNGTDATRLSAPAGQSAVEIVAAWRAAGEKFREDRKRWLL